MLYYSTLSLEVLFIVFFLWKSTGEPYEVRLYPQSLLILMTLCLAGIIYFDFKHRKKEQKASMPGEIRNKFFAIILFFFYLLSLSSLGFLLATFLFYFLWLSILEKKFNFTNLLMPIVLVTAVFLLFHGMLNVPLPGGIIESLLGIQM